MSDDIQRDCRSCISRDFIDAPQCVLSECSTGNGYKNYNRDYKAFPEKKSAIEAERDALRGACQLLMDLARKHKGTESEIKLPVSVIVKMKSALAMGES